MHRIRLILRSTLIALTVAGPALAVDLRVGLGMQDALPGAQSGGLSEFNESLARELCRRMQAHCLFEPMGFPDILPAVESSRIDLGFGNYLRTPERERRVAFSNAIWRSSSRLAGLPARVRQLTDQMGRTPSLENLHDVRVAVLQDTQQAAYLQSLPAQRRVGPVAIRTLDQMRAAIESGRADLALLPVLSAYALRGVKPAVVLDFVGPAYAGDGLGGTVHIAMPLKATALRGQINLAIAGMRADGTWLRIVRQYFPFNLD